MAEKTTQEALAGKLLLVVRFIRLGDIKGGYAPDGQDVAAVIHRRSCTDVPTSLVDEGQFVEIGQECLLKVGCWVLFANEEEARERANQYARKRQGNITIEPLTCCLADN